MLDGVNRPGFYVELPFRITNLDVVIAERTTDRKLRATAFTESP